MPVYLTPGVYIEEIPSGARPIESTATSVAAFVGPARRGPAGVASRIASLNDYHNLYGNITSEADAMGLAVQAFYLNGGKTAYICRIAGGGSAAASVEIAGEATGGDPVLIVTASSVGAWGEDIYLKIDKPNPEALNFDVLIGRRVNGRFEVEERFAGLSMREESDNYVVSVLNELSQLVQVKLGKAAAIDDSAAKYQNAELLGGETGASPTYFTSGLAGATTGTLALNLYNRGQELIAIDLSEASFAGTDHDADASTLAAAVQAGIRAHSPLAEYQGVTVSYAANRLKITVPEDNSRAALAVGGGSLAKLMRMTAEARTVLSGGAMGSSATLFSSSTTGVVAPANGPSEISISIDGHGPFNAVMEFPAGSFAGANASDGNLVAAALQTAIRAAAPHLPGFAGAEVVYDSDRQFVITSGNNAPQDSGLNVEAGNFADFLKLSTDADTVKGRVLRQGVAPVIPQQLSGAGGEGAQLLGGVSVAPSGADYAGFYGDTLRKIPDVTMILLPGAPYGADGPSLAISSTLAFAESRQQMMVLLDPPPGVELASDQALDDLLLPTSSYATLYYPWVECPNPLYDADLNPTAKKTVLIAPSAFAAGIWTKTDARRGIWKAPAGVEARLIGATALEFAVEEKEQSVLNPRGVNCYRKMPSYGPVVWGARTLATRAVPEWRYVPVRRTALFIEKSIQDGIQWAVFQPNAHPLWASLRANIGGFMDGLFRAGAFQGEKANDAYFVRCNLGDTMTQADIDRGQVIVVVGFAPLKPAEFVIVRIQQKVGDE